MGKKRLLEEHIWAEDWFLDMPEQYKLLYLYIRGSGCDHAGIWRVNKRQFQTVCNKILHLDDFLSAVNKDELGGGTENRVIALDKHRWWVPNVIPDNYGGTFINNNYHISMLKLLVSNNIDINLVPNYDWLNYKGLDNQRLRVLLFTKSKGTVVEVLANTIVPELVPEPVSLMGKGVQGENNFGTEQVPFPLQTLYEKNWNDITQIESFARKMTEAGFNQWKKFVDFVRANNFYPLFTCKFVYPQDWIDVVNGKVKSFEGASFTEDVWLEVCKNMVSSGIDPAKHNLYFRIPQFVQTLKKGGSAGSNGQKSTKSNVDTGNVNYGAIKGAKKIG